MENLNILSMIIATLLPMIIGFLYYGKFLFGKAWMASIGMTEEQQKKGNMPVIFGGMLVMSLVISFYLLTICNAPGQEGQFDTFKHGAYHGAVSSLFLIMPAMVTTGLFEQRTWKNMLINGLYWLVTLVLMGGILDAMNHFPNVAK
ncbi:MAG: DUF1761 domain-containing protein [Lewinellaceae bacterium]|nr:DUF1761 domain-containing protein [Lewinellaceae bacterium]